MSLTPRRAALLADAGLLYAAAIWGSTFVMVKDALAGVDALVLVGVRFLLAGGLLLVYLIARRRPLTAQLGRSLGLGLCLWGLYATQTIGLEFTTASNSGFITGLFVVFVPLFLVTLFRRRPRRIEILASGLALLGLWFLTGGLAAINPGDLLTLVAAMAYALHLLLSDRAMKAGLDPVLTSCQQFLLVGLLSLAAAGVAGRPFSITMPALGAIHFLAVFPTLSAFVIQMFAQRRTSPARVSLIFALEPVFAALFAWTVGGESFTAASALGGGLIVGALVLSSLGSRP